LGFVAAAWSLAAHSQESATSGTTASLPQIEVARVKPVDRMPANIRLSDDLIDLMNGFSLSSAQAIGGAWRAPLRPPTPSTNLSGNGKSVRGRCGTKDACIRADEVIE